MVKFKLVTQTFFLILTLLVAGVIAAPAPEPLRSLVDDVGDDKGNGGDVVVCYDEQKKIKSVQLLDHYEGYKKFGFVIDLGDGQGPLNKVKFVLDHLSKFDEGRAKRYWQQAQNFESESLFWPGVELVDIPDSQHIAIPKNCKIEQVAIQQEPTLPEQKRFTISKDLWDLMDDTNRAGLILHEIIFQEAIELHQTNSIRSRYFNAMISQKNFHLQNFEYYSLRRKAAGLELANGCVVYPKWQGLKLKNVHLDPHSGSSEDTLQAELCEPGNWTLSNGRILPVPMSINPGWPTKLTFFKDGRLNKLWSNSAPLKVDFKVGFAPSKEIKVRTDGSFGDGIVFNLDGTVRSTMFAEDTPLHQIGDCEMTLPSQADFIVSEGRLEIIRPVLTALCFPTPEGGIYKMQTDYRQADALFINANGFVSSLNGASKFEVPVHKRIVSFEYTYMVFHPNGIVKTASFLKSDEDLMTETGEIKRFKKGANLEFNPEGKVIREVKP